MTEKKVLNGTGTGNTIPEISNKNMCAIHVL